MSDVLSGTCIYATSQTGCDKTLLSKHFLTVQVCEHPDPAWVRQRVHAERGSARGRAPLPRVPPHGPGRGGGPAGGGRHHRPGQAAPGESPQGDQQVWAHAHCTVLVAFRAGWWIGEPFLTLSVHTFLRGSQIRPKRYRKYRIGRPSFTVSGK